MISATMSPLSVLVLLAVWTTMMLGTVDAAALGRHRRFDRHAKTVRSEREELEMQRRDTVASTFASQFPSTDDLHLFTSTITSLGSSGLTVLSNTTHALFSLNVSSSLTSSNPADFGYVALGVGGTTMATTVQMVIAFPDSSATTQGGWAVSSRAATGHSMPKALDSSVAPAPTVVGDLSQSPNMLTFVIPFARSSDSTKQGLNMVFAYSSNAVKAASDGNPDEATISQHDDGMFGSFVADLSQPVTVNGDGSLSGGSTATGGGSSSYHTIIVAHAVVGALAWMIVAPGAVLIARLGRNWHGTWFKLHSRLQAFVTTTLTLGAVALAIVAVKMSGSGFTADGHHILGFVLLILVGVQAGLGQHIHKKLDPQRTKRPPRNLTHIFLGVTLLLGGWTQVMLGLRLYAKQTAGGLSMTPFTLFWIFVIIPIVLYLISCTLLAHDRRKGGMSWGMSLFGLGRSGGARGIPLSSSENEKAPSWHYQNQDDVKEKSGFFSKLGMGSKKTKLADPAEVPRGGKVSPFAYQDPFQQQSKTESWGNGVVSRGDLDAFNNAAVQGGYAIGAGYDQQDPAAQQDQYSRTPPALRQMQSARDAQTPIANQYLASDYRNDPAAARERAGGVKDLALQPKLTNDPTSGYRQQTSTGGYYSDARARAQADYYARQRGAAGTPTGLAAMRAGHGRDGSSSLGHRAGQGSVAGSEASFASNSSRQHLVSPSMYGAHTQRAMDQAQDQGAGQRSLYDPSGRPVPQRKPTRTFRTIQQG